VKIYAILCVLFTSAKAVVLYQAEFSSWMRLLWSEDEWRRRAETWRSSPGTN